MSNALRTARPPRPNLSYTQKTALKDLRKDNTIVILPADKGNATVVMDRSLYEEKMKEILLDGNTYRKLKRDPTTHIEKTVAEKVKQLHRNGLIPDQLKDQLTPSYSNPPQIYGVPKIHKDNNPLRPIIVSTIGSPTYRLAKELARTPSHH